MLKKIREKPHHIKQSIALALTIVIFSGILFVWWSSRDARSREVEVREKTVSPANGVASMFSGFVAGFKERISDTLTPSRSKDLVEPTITADTFDLSGVVVIDHSTSTATTTAITTKGK